MKPPREFIEKVLGLISKSAILIGQKPDAETLAVWATHFAKVLLNDMLEFLNHKDQTGLYPTYNTNKPNTGSTWKNQGIIMYESNNQYCKGRNYNTWRDYCPSC